LPITFALTNPKTDERDIALDMFDHDPSLFDGRDHQTVVAHKGYASREFEARLAQRGIRAGAPPHSHARANGSTATEQRGSGPRRASSSRSKTRWRPDA
jgi:hypothetical protein